jgi:hypothetical protein
LVVFPRSLDGGRLCESPQGRGGRQPDTQYLLRGLSLLQRTQAMKWGMLDFEDEEPDRPEFKGDRIKSLIVVMEVEQSGNSTIWQAAFNFTNSIVGAGVVVGCISTTTLSPRTTVF